MRVLRFLETHPMVAPNPHTTGISEKPSALFVESVSSPITLFITPVRSINRMCECIYGLSYQYCHLAVQSNTDCM